MIILLILTYNVFLKYKFTQICSGFTANFTLFFDYTYNGKEKDYETGFHYYGSRYYSSELSIWNSTDPLADKYPSISPYSYCGWNPVIFYDPNGEEKVISLNTENGNKIEDNKQIKRAAENYPENENVIHLWAHGRVNEEGQCMGITIYDVATNSPKSIQSIANFSDFLKNESEIFNMNNKEGEASKTSILVMHSCSTGQEGAIGQRVSEILDLLVIAPTDNVLVTVSNNKSEEVGVKNHGGWNIFYRGEKVGSFDGNTKPIFTNPQKTIEKYEKVYQEKFGND